MSLEGKSWSVLDVVVPGAAVDLVSGVLFEHGCLGLEEREAAAGRVAIRAWFERGAERAAAAGLGRHWESIGAIVPDLGRPEIRLDEVAYDGWAENWKAHFRPFRVGRHLVVSPTWESPPREEGDRLVQIDPGMAFGTGNHETTQLCLAHLETILAESPGLDLLDVGCGSGILSIAAVLSGAREATGVDIDPDAVRIAAENAALNGVAEKLHLSDTPVGSLEGTWPLVVANILAHILIEIAPHLGLRVAPGGRLLLSGILATQAADVERAYAAEGLTLVATDSIAPRSGREDDRWVLLEFQKGVT